MNGTLTRDPCAALAWYKAGNPIRIVALNLADWLRHIEALATLEASEPLPPS